MAVPSDYNIVFNGFELPLAEEVSRPRTAKERRSEAPGLPRGFSGGSLATMRIITVRGILKFGGSLSRTAAINNLSAALPEGVVQPLYINSATQYLLAEPFTLDCDEKSDYIGAIPYEAVFEVHDPFYWQAGAYHVTDFGGGGSGTPVGGTVTYAGTAPSSPQVIVSVASLPAVAGVGYIDVLNDQQSGTGFRLYPTAIGDVTVDGYTETVTRAGVDVMAEFRGVYSELQTTNGGSNALSIAVGGGLTASNVRVQYPDRYR